MGQLLALRLSRAAPWVFLAAAVGLALALRGVEPQRPAEVPPPPRPSRPTRWVGIGLALLGAALAVFWSLRLSRDWDASLFSAAKWGAAGLLLFALGLDLAAGYGPRWRPRLPATRGGRAWAGAGLLLLVLAAGFYFRFREFGQFPPSDGFASVEEPQEGTIARRVLEKRSRPWEWAMAMYIPAASFRLFGYGMEALRGPAMALGFLTLPVFWLLAREVAGGPAALFATALLAVSRWHCQVSWYSDDVFLPVFFFTLLLYLLFRARRDRRPLWFVLVGALAGESLFEYAAFRVAPLVALGFFALALLRPPRREKAGRFAVAAAVALLFVPPLLGVLRREHPGRYFEALRRSMENTDYYTQDLRSFVRLRMVRAEAAAKSLTVTDDSVFFETLNTDTAPLLDPFTSALFVLGLGTTLLLPKRRDHFFLAGSFLVLVVGATIVVQNLDFRRTGILIPLAFLFPALLAGRLLALDGSKPMRGAIAALLALVVLAAGAWNHRFLFEKLAKDYRVRAMHRNPYTVPAFYLHRHHRGEYVFLVVPPDGYPVGNFFEGTDYDWLKPAGLEGRVVSTLEEALAPEPKAERRGTLVLMAAPLPFEESVARVRQFRPDAQCEIRPDPDSPDWSLAACRWRGESAASASLRSSRSSHRRTDS